MLMMMYTEHPPSGVRGVYVQYMDRSFGEIRIGILQYRSPLPQLEVSYLCRYVNELYIDAARQQRSFQRTEIVVGLPHVRSECDYLHRANLSIEVRTTHILNES